jgi:hypothetical protein
VPNELIFNIDDCGFSDWEERKAKLVLISSRVRNASLHDRVDRRIRHQTLICCITGDGDVYYPLLVSAGRPVTKAFERGVRNGIGLKSELASLPYVAQDILNRRIHEVLIPAVVSKQAPTGRKGKPVVLLGDNGCAHCSDEVPKESRIWRPPGKIFTSEIVSEMGTDQ